MAIYIDRVKFAAALAKKNMNLKELAEKSGVSRVTVSAVKCGKSCSEKTGRALAAILGESIIARA